MFHELLMLNPNSEIFDPKTVAEADLSSIRAGSLRGQSSKNSVPDWVRIILSTYCLN
jgi:hypothetical protein